MMRISHIASIAFAATFACSVLEAAVVTVTPSSTNWANPPGENGAGGSSSITNTSPRSGNGSVEMFGDRTRFVGLGNFYDSSSNIGLLSDLSSFTFDWSVALDSISALGPNYTPALRLHLWDGLQRSELIWEGAYNALGTITKGDWYTTGASDNFWQFQSGIGVTAVYDRDISDWQSIYSQNAYIAGISVGAGSSVGSDYHAFADNVTLTWKNGDSSTYNFETEKQQVSDTGSTSLLGLLALSSLIAARRFNYWKR
ncbi:hypothetical protein QEH56_09475 [Pelagicoccus enzymogenes]|uniref:hypothetical protein n=1 Tax=Pelagicoccus enzymogenes TaxID=2773457 RepID=UPI00280E9A40|nr:hypothetical protein [Pelagicoccus enzymogenes]MDQ8198377.1 hypothetical protein [Pelagicoccus enzymogenes]